MRAKREEIVGWVTEFLDLDGMRRERDLFNDEILRWYELKQKIETALFAKPPYEADKRRFIRIPNVSFAGSFDDGISRTDGIIKEISEGGMFVSTNDPSPAGTDLTVTLYLPQGEGFDAKEVNVQAKVVYTNFGSSMTAQSFNGMGLTLLTATPKIEMEKWQSVMHKLLRDTAQTFSANA